MTSAMWPTSSVIWGFPENRDEEEEEESLLIGGRERQKARRSDGKAKRGETDTGCPLYRRSILTPNISGLLSDPAGLLKPS